MPIFGVHESISGGFDRAVSSAAEGSFGCVQFFSKNSNQWKSKTIEPLDVQKFQEALAKTGISHPQIHDSYLINLASVKDSLRLKSIEALADECNRAGILGVENVVIHPGATTGDSSSEAEISGLKRIAESIDQVFSIAGSGSNVTILLETTAGQGTSLGWKFEHLAKIIELSDNENRLGVCIDTCHIFAAGYPITEKSDYDKTMRHFASVIGFEKLRAFHLNDSIKGLGSRVDRHEHIGRGMIGIDAFRHIVNDSRFSTIPMYLETPKGICEDKADWDVVNLKTLKNLAISRKHPI